MQAFSQHKSVVEPVGGDDIIDIPKIPPGCCSLQYQEGYNKKYLHLNP